MTGLYASSKTLSEFNEIEILADWKKANKLPLNLDKTNYMLLSGEKIMKGSKLSCRN